MLLLFIYSIEFRICAPLILKFYRHGDTVRSAPVLVGDEAIEFLERIEALRHVPDPAYPSKEELKAFKQCYREYLLRQLNELSDD